MRTHPRWVRISHWILAASVLTLAVSGVVILMAHPRLYWGEAGNDLMPALIELPFTPNSGRVEFTDRAPIFQDAGSPISANRTTEIFNQNGWGRSLHFLAVVPHRPRSRVPAGRTLGRSLPFAHLAAVG